MSKAIAELENFTTSELDGLKDELKVKLQALRYLSGLPIYVTSGVRSNSDEHALGMAADISDNPLGDPISSTWRFEVLRAAFAIGFRRIGDYDRHLHLGISKSLDQDVCWHGLSD